MKKVKLKTIIDALEWVNDEISGRDIIKILDKLQKIAKKDVNLFKEFIDTVKGK